jgi:hypothetical protein
MRRKDHLAVAMATVVGMGLASLPASGDGWPPNTFLANYVTNVYVTEATPAYRYSLHLYRESKVYFAAGDQLGRQKRDAGFTRPQRPRRYAGNIPFFLPPTPIGNNTTWTGTYTKIIIPGAPLLGPFPFSGSFQRTTPLTFIGTMTFTNLPFGDNTSSCNVSMQFSSALTGIVP